MANRGSLVMVHTADGTKRFPPLKASEILGGLLGFHQQGVLDSTEPDGLSYTGSIDVPPGEYKLVPAAGAAAGAAAAVPGLAEQLQNLQLGVASIKQQLQAKAELRFTFSSGKTGKTHAVDAAMSAMQLAGIQPITSLPRLKPAVRSQDYTPAEGWSGSVREDDMAPRLLQHMQEQFEQFGVTFGKGGFELKDVHRQHRLGFRLDTPIGRLVFEGGADAVVVPWGELMWPQQLRMVFDWKQPQELRRLDSFALGGTFQAQLKMLGALTHSQHPALVVFTDGCNFFVLQPYDASLRYLQTLLPHSPGYAAPSDAFRFLVHHLLEVCSPTPSFTAAQAGLTVNSELQMQLRPLLRVRQVFGVDEGLAEQLQAVKFLPENEQLNAAAGLILAWRGEHSTDLASANGHDVCGVVSYIS